MRRHVELGFERMRHACPNEPEEAPRRGPRRKAPAEQKNDQM
jgi:hypothetical protein